MNTLTPLIHKDIQDLVNQKELLFQAKQLYAGPVHIIVPTIMDENIKRLDSFFKDLQIQSAIYYAHKPNKSLAFVKQALKNHIGIDVASRQELISALSAGYDGKDISCTGTKNEEFLYLALQQSCLISIDSLGELKMVSRLKGALGKNARVMLRIADPISRDRNFKIKLSRFGIAREHVQEAYKILQKENINLVGFHFHNDERSADLKAGFLADMLTMLEHAYAKGFTPSIINIGGGLRTSQLHQFGEWSAFLNDIEHNLLNLKPTDTWRNFGFGMFVNEKNKISGREKIQGKYVNQDFTEVLNEMLSSPSLTNRPLAEIIRESMLTIMVEPGFALLQHCGISLITVVGTQQAPNGEGLIALDGNTYNLSTQINELLMDPLLISKEKNADSFSGYPIGNLCREEDFIMKRKIYFKQTPRPGDMLCFINTAAYTSDFEDATPHQHLTGKKLVALKTPSGWRLQAEEVYNPFITTE